LGLLWRWFLFLLCLFGWLGMGK